MCFVKCICRYVHQLIGCFLDICYQLFEKETIHDLKMELVLFETVQESAQMPKKMTPCECV